MTPRELVHATLDFKNTSSRAPRQIWRLPWVDYNDPETLKRILHDFPEDFGGAPGSVKNPKTEGDPYEIGTYIDPWGAIFHNIQRGVHGEVKRPAITGDDYTDLSGVHFPEEWMTIDEQAINKACAESELFMFASACPRPFEQLQFLRGSEQLFMDLAYMPKGMMDFIERMHDLYCRIMRAWAKTDVDALQFMDDWGSQRSLLISPKMWDELFGPLYRDYIDIAHAHGKKIFMHTDGYTLDIIPRLIDMGLDAINSQIFCMGVDNLSQYAGKITFWGEIDRQHILPSGTPEDVDKAVRDVHAKLWRDGGCIAQCEFTVGSKGENVYQVYKSWSEVLPE